MKNWIKIVIDIAMTTLYFILMAHQMTGQTLHEVLGMILISMFIVHNILNYKWYKVIKKGKYTVVRIVITVINFMLLILMIGMLFSGISISQVIIDGNSIIKIPFAREIHSLCAYWGLVLIGIHLGLHWGMMIAPLKKKIEKLNNSSYYKSLFKISSMIIASYGAVAFLKREIWAYLTLYYSYSFWDYNELALKFFIDYISVMALVTFMTYNIFKLIKKESIKKIKN